MQKKQTYAYERTTPKGDTFWYLTDTATGRTCTDKIHENKHREDTTIVWWDDE